MDKIQNIIKIIIFALTVFFLAIFIWYSPSLFKGYTPHTLTPQVIIGRNLAQTGVYGAENDFNVLLSSDLVKDQAHISSSGNKLSAVLYEKLFKILGPLDEKSLVLLSISFHAFTLVILTLLILHFFNFKVSLIFSLIYILLPFNWRLPYHLGTYEFALLFFSLFFLFYLCGIKQKRNYIYLGISGIFLALACLSREALLLFVPFLFIYLCVVKQKRYLLYIFIPFLILFSYLWIPDALMMKEGTNTYLLHFTTQAPEKLKSADFARYGHLFPDPYTYHFNREEFLKDYQNQLNSKEIDFYAKTDLIKAGANIGIRSPSFLERIKVGLVLSFNHASRLFSLEEIGGPFVSLLMILGIYNLRERNKYLYRFSLGWTFSIIFLLSFVVLAGRNHLMDFGWVLALCIALGLIMLTKIINTYFHFNQMKSKILLMVVLLITLYGLILANHVAWNTIFDQNQENYLRINVFNKKIKDLNIPDEKVIASPFDLSYVYRLNYLNNKSFVVFRTETVEDLLNNEKLNSAFKKFEVGYVLGYSDGISKKITDQTQVINIASDSIQLPNLDVSPNKMWLLNLIR